MKIFFKVFFLSSVFFGFLLGGNLSNERFNISLLFANSKIKNFSDPVFSDFKNIFRKQSCSMIVSPHIISYFLGYYDQEGLVKKFIKWKIYKHHNNSLYLFISKDSLNDVTQEHRLTMPESNFGPVTITGFKINQAQDLSVDSLESLQKLEKSIHESIELNPMQNVAQDVADYIYNENDLKASLPYSRFEDLQEKIDFYRSLLPEWNFYIIGHGEKGLIVNLDTSQFKNLMKILNMIRVNFAIFLSCRIQANKESFINPYAGGSSDAQFKSIKFPFALVGITDVSIVGDETKEKTIDNFFKQLSFQTQTMDSFVNSVYSFFGQDDTIKSSVNLSEIYFPGVGLFSLYNLINKGREDSLSNKIFILGQAKDNKALLEAELHHLYKKHPLATEKAGTVIVPQNKSIVIVGEPTIKSPVIIESNSLVAIVPQQKGTLAGTCQPLIFDEIRLPNMGIFRFLMSSFSRIGKCIEIKIKKLCGNNDKESTDFFEPFNDKKLCFENVIIHSKQDRLSTTLIVFFQFNNELYTIQYMQEEGKPIVKSFKKIVDSKSYLSTINNMDYFTLSNGEGEKLLERIANDYEKKSHQKKVVNFLKKDFLDKEFEIFKRKEKDFITSFDYGVNLFFNKNQKDELTDSVKEKIEEFNQAVRNLDKDRIRQLKNEIREKIAAII